MPAAQGLDAVIVHPSGILGPGDFGQGHLTQMIADYLNGRLVACVKGGYDFVDVRDVADGVIAAAEKGRAGECYILSNRHYEVRELLDMASAPDREKEDTGGAAHVAGQGYGAAFGAVLPDGPPAAAVHPLFPLYPDQQ